jgi:hypothetical protein
MALDSKQGSAGPPCRDGLCFQSKPQTKPEIGKNQAVARFRSLTRHLHSLGPRPVGEFMLELGRAHVLEREIVGLLEEFAALDPLLVDACDGCDWPALPLEPVP